MLNNEEIKVGKKVKQVSDGTIWTVTRKLTDTDWAIERESDDGKILVSMLSTKECKFCIVRNSYTFDVISRVTVEASSEEQAKRALCYSLVDEVEDIKLVSKEEFE